MLQVKLPIVDTIQQQSNKFGMGVKFKVQVTPNLMTALAYYHRY